MSQKAKVLLVDDIPSNLHTLSGALAGEFDIYLATSGAIGLQMAEELCPDIILLDVMMPEMDGYEVCRRLKANEQLECIPVVFVTALGDVNDEARGLELGAVDYLTKPVNVHIARQRIRNLIRMEQLRKQVEAQRDHLEHMVTARTQALSIAKDAAETANRAKTAFLANMSHELRTPLSGIIGMIELVMRKLDDPDLKSRLMKADKAAHDLLVIINDVLDISKIEADRLILEHVDFRLGEVLENVRSLMQVRAEEKQLLLNLSMPDELASLPVRGDPLRLGQILLNLVGNAVKFTPAGSVDLHVETEPSAADRVRLRFVVRDSGIGIAPESQQRIFDAFEQADGSMTRKHGGTGLGLAICKRLVRLMGGEIDVASQPGDGSAFWFTVELMLGGTMAPRMQADPDHAAEDQIKARYAGRKILLVEDEPINQEVSLGLLEDAGLQVDLAGDGAEAVELASINDYVMILMDIQMPKMSGIEATHAIRQLPGHEATPILAMTANAFDEDRRQCFESGMNDFISKPVKPEVLFSTLLKWLSRSSR